MAKQTLITKLENFGIRLNPEQLAAVKFIKGNSIVQAGPGTGKTTVVVAKILHTLIADPTAKVLAISFTRKSVAELQSRLPINDNVTISTFHGFYYRILKTHGYRSFKFFQSEADKRSFITKLLADNNLNDVVTVEEVLETITTGKPTNDNLVKCLDLYLESLKDARTLCYDALQYYVKELITSNPAIADKIRNYYDFIIIDEAQDMSGLQVDIAKLIWNSNAIKGVCFVGDSNQSIYGFRGAKADVMDELKQTFKAKIFTLKSNYRSSAEILSIANAVLPTAPTLISQNGENKIPPVFYRAENQESEARFVIAEIKKLLNEGYKLRNIAILFRSAPAIDVLFEALIDAQIPFVKQGSDCGKWSNSRFKKFFKMMVFLHTRSITNFLSIATCFGIPKDFIIDMGDCSNQTLTEFLLSTPSLSKRQRETLQSFLNVSTDGMTLTELTQFLWKNYLKELFKAETDDILDEFLELTMKFETFAELNTHLLLLRRVVQKMNKLTADPNADYLRLLSIHTSKGTEIHIVFLVGATEGILPDLAHENVNIDEENRLAYVATTRAKERIYISYPQKGMKDNNEPSRFFGKYFC